MQQHSILLASFLSLLTLHPAAANNDSTSSLVNDELADELSWLREETMVISASRVAESLKKTAASVTVIDEEQIRVMGATNLWDLLRTVPGLGVTEGRINLDKVESRGIMTLFSEKVLMLLDSHPIDANLVNGGSTFVLQHFPLDHIKRIEIVRGPGSALYGANAFLAVVNILTKHANDMPGIEIAARAGSEDTQEGSVLVGKKLGRFDFSTALFAGRTDGFSAYVNNDFLGQSGYTNPWRETVHLDVKLEEEHFFFNGRYHTEDTGPAFGFTGTLNDEDKGDFLFYSLQAGYKNTLAEALSMESKVYYDTFQFDNHWELFPEGSVLGPYTYPEGFVARSADKNSKYGIDGIMTWKPAAAHTIVVGATFEQQRQFDVIYEATYNPLTSAPNDPPVMLDYSDPAHTWAPDVNRRLWAIYGEEIWDINPSLRVTLGLRHDNYSDFGGTTNPRLGFSYQFNPHYTIKGLYGQAFRAPTFAELYNINNPVVVGNPELQPEIIKTAELGLHVDYAQLGLSGQLTLFQNKIEDLIEESGATYTNRGAVETEGAELEMRLDLGRGAFILGNYTYLQARDPERQVDLPNVAQHRGNLIFNWRASTHINLLTEAYFKGATQRPAGDSRDELAGYGLLHMAAVASSFPGWAKPLELRLRVNNLLDKEYADPVDLGYTSDDYQQPGRNFWLELRYKFQ